jgi:hypothetical protein
MKVQSVSWRITTMLHEIAQSRMNELRAAETAISHRMAWENISRMERLERALRTARGRLQGISNITAKAS